MLSLRQFAPLLVFSSCVGLSVAAEPLSAANQLNRKPVISAVCTPTTVRIGGAPAKPAKNPIAVALSAAGPGSSIRLEAGRYPRFGIGFKDPKGWNATTTGGTKAQPILLYSNGGAVIHHNGGGDTIAISSQLSPGHITFQNLQIIPGYRAGVIFYGGAPNNRYEGFRFLDCDILGSWDHLKNSGEKSTWGLWAYGLADFEFRGVRRRAKVENIRKEHGFYIQNPQGDVTIENVDARFLGRTFCQFTARASDGPPGRGKITVKNCRVEDVCIAATDNFKGGSAMTFAGRLQGSILLEGNEVRIGYSAGILRLTQPREPYGTGALMVWDAHKEANGSVVLRGNRFQAAPGCGDRSLVSIGGAQRLSIEGDNTFSAQGKHATLALDPAERGGRPTNTPIGAVYMDPATSIEGDVTWFGHALTTQERARIAVPLKEREAEPKDPESQR